ncbi:MAG TPA: DEAD/DEAH box helicase [Acidimicrobiales bacterium]|nr:DEAD/DEAH box helicase [Acidimicrobiales bacterium]
MSRSVRLRPWQKRALDRLAATAAPDFLAVATPGAGKTTFALCAAVHDLAANRGRRLVVVAPTSHLKLQWADAAAGFGLHLEPRWTPSGGRLPADVHGIVTTYQQVASSPDALRPLVAGSLAVLDEIHHAGDDRAWGDAVRRAFEPAAQRLALSGTPFRSDTRAIPFVRYVGDEAVPDFEYGYADALADGRVVRPVYFPRINGFMEWIAPDGAAQAAAFDDPLDRARAAQRLRTALSVEGEWLPTVLAQANERLGMLRRQQPDAGGLVVATDQDHAQGIADLLRYRCGVRATVAVSDDPRSSSRIARFSASSDSWIVAVRMVSEGVDIPRLRVGVYATTTTTELFFRQAVGRFVRWTRGVPRQKAYLFIPDDLRLRTWATQIADARRHSLRRPERDGGETVDDSALDARVHPDDRGEQLSMFAALSAVVTGAAESSVFDVDEAVLDRFDRQEDDAALELTLPALPGAPAAGTPTDGDGNGANPRRDRSELRERNSRLVQDLVWATGLGHAQINGQLNRLVGLRRIDEATVEQLRRRARQAESWLAKTQQ